MTDPLAQFYREYNLKPFYSIALSQINSGTASDTIDLLQRMAPFIRQFQTKFATYYGLTKRAAIDLDHHENRLLEFYSHWCEQILSRPWGNAVTWLLEQTIDGSKPFFPDRPIADNYQDIMRSLNVLVELFKHVPVSDEGAYERLFSHIRRILSPQLDDAFESEGKALLDQLTAFDARKQGVSSVEFEALKAHVGEMNQKIRSQLMSNNTFVSITQQITDINKALKTVRKADITPILEEPRLEQFWEALTDHGYSGGENYLYGDYAKHKASIQAWLHQAYPQEAEALLKTLEQIYYGPELPNLDKENIPEALQLYSINLLGAVGLKTEEAIRLVLTYQSRFVDKMVRDGAFQALKQNGERVQDYFLRSLGEVDDYEQMLTIAEKHDAIFQHISPLLLTRAFGNAFHPVLSELKEITRPDGVLLSNFIRSAYLRESKAHLQSHFESINERLKHFKRFVERKSPHGFIFLIRMWGFDYIVSWALSDFEKEERLFSFIVSAAKDTSPARILSANRVIPMEDIITLLSKEPDAKELIQKLMTYLLNSKISFDYRLFSSLFQVVAQRRQQLAGGISIRDGFSEQRGYHHSQKAYRESDAGFQLEDPHIFHPIVVFLITILHMKFINIPKDAFVETDISLYLNSLAEHQKNPELGYQMYLAHELISSIPYIKDFSSQHETVIRKTIADLDESYKRRNVLFHYHRIKIHRAPSKLDLDFCLEILEGLSSRPLDKVLSHLIRLMKGIGDEAVPDMREYFQLYEKKLQQLGHFLKLFKSAYPDTDWQDIAEDSNFSKIVRDLPGIESDTTKDIIALVKLVNALSNYWTQRINESFLDECFGENEKEQFKQSPLSEQLAIVRNRRKHFQAIINRFDPQLEPYQHIFLKRHVIQGDWNFDFFGFWPYYKESKFEAYNADRRLSELERQLLQKLMNALSPSDKPPGEVDSDALAHLRRLIDCLRQIMIHLVDEGLAPSRYFMDTIEIFENDQLTISQLHDILNILMHRELSHVDTFVANTFGHFPAQITRALGRENLDFGLDKLDVEDEELFYPLVQETVLGHIIAGLHPIHLLEDHLTRMLSLTQELKKQAISMPIYEEGERPPDRLSPVYFGYKSYALQTLAQDGFNVPALETLPVTFFNGHPEYIDDPALPGYRSVLIDALLKLEQKTGKAFGFNMDYLDEQQRSRIRSSRAAHSINEDTASVLMISARSGSYRSMPGILGTVLNIGQFDPLSTDDPTTISRLDLDSYRMFLSTLGNVVFGINEIHFSRIVESVKKELQTAPTHKVRWEDLSNDQIIRIIQAFKQLIEESNNAREKEAQFPLDWDDPLDLLAISTIGVWNSWFSQAAVNLRHFLDISPDWYTPVTLMEMKQADKNRRSFSAILFSGDPQGKLDKPHGDLLYGRPGEDIASGLASGGIHLENLETEDPELYRQIADLLEAIKINKGYVNVDVEMVGEYDPVSEQMELFVVQERQMPLGARCESEDFRLVPTDKEPIATGKGVNGGAQYGVFLDGVNRDYYELKKAVKEIRLKLGEKDAYHGPGIFLLMNYVTPGEALKMNIDGVDGIITTKIGKSSHASIAAKRDGKLFVCETSVYEDTEGWTINNRRIRLGDESDPDIFTVIGHQRSISPYSGNIYEGAMPLTPVLKQRR